MEYRLLYLLKSRDGEAFKIGVSLDPARRSAALPQAIDLSQSVQVNVTKGSAYKVEEVLHYLFRDRAKPMPFGAGYTEWFEIAAWPAVLDFLREHAERLGIGEPLPIPLPVLARPSRRDDPEIRRQRIEEQKQRAAEQQAERRTFAEANNRATVEWLRQFLRELDEAGVIRGILVYDEERTGQREAALFLTGRAADIRRLTEPMNRAQEPIGDMRSAGGGAHPVLFCRYSQIGDRRGCSLLEVCDELLTLPPEFAAQVPYAERARELLLPYVAQVGSRLGPQLVRLHRLMTARQRAFRSDFGQEWAAASGGVW
ncbi:GIY-YIG nuclease family protein [Rhizobium binxianense]